MKKHLMKFVAVGALVAAALVGDAAAQTAPPVEPMVGGYGKAAVGEAAVVRAAKFAVKARAKKQPAKIRLVAVARAEKQVVAGMNYRLCLNVEAKEKNKKIAVPQIVQTIVFQSLKNKFELTSWTVAACTDELQPMMPSEQ